MVLLEKITSSNKDLLCIIKNTKRNQEYSVIFYKNGTYKIVKDDVREIKRNHIAYNRLLNKIFET